MSKTDMNYDKEELIRYELSEEGMLNAILSVMTIDEREYIFNQIIEIYDLYQDDEYDDDDEDEQSLLYPVYGNYFDDKEQED